MNSPTLAQLKAAAKAKGLGIGQPILKTPWITLFELGNPHGVLGAWKTRCGIPKSEIHERVMSMIRQYGKRDDLQ